LVGTAVAPLIGLVATARGARKSGPDPTTNCVGAATAALPVPSVTPLTVIVTTWLSGNAACGVMRFSFLADPAFSVAADALAAAKLPPA
jgi:hypothetical protein